MKKATSLKMALMFISVISHSAFASFARVESMGKKAVFFMDDISIFDNPANINVFPNFLIGEMGSFLPNDIDKSAIQDGSFLVDSVSYVNPRYNRDPQDPWFGGIFSYSAGKEEEGNFYPQYSIAGAFNRRDESILSLLPDSVVVNSSDSSATVVVPQPVTNFDGFIGATLRGGGMLGAHIYMALQDGANFENGKVIGGLDPDISLTVYKGNLGLNWPIGRNIDGELSVGGAIIGFGPSSIDRNVSFFTKARAFITFEMIKGEVVPVFRYSNMNLPGKEIVDITAGIGINASLDRGFFWVGAEFLSQSSSFFGYSSNLRYYDPSRHDNLTSDKQLYGANISFGIERNIWWDWLVLRVGGQKLIALQKQDGDYFMVTNPSATGTPSDNIGFGIGINVEEKLKVDATLAEDFLYTGGALLSGPQHHVISRVSATYSF